MISYNYAALTVKSTAMISNVPLKTHTERFLPEDKLTRAAD